MERTTHACPDGRVYHVRLAATDDAASLLEHVRTLTGEAGQLIRTSPGEFDATLDQETAWIQARAEPGNLLLLAVDDTEAVIGNIDFACGDRRRIRHTGEFGIGVGQAWRGAGVGTTLVRRLLEWAGGEPQIERVALGVIEGNPAVRLYERMGFEHEGRRRGAVAIGDRRLDMLLMSCPV